MKKFIDNAPKYEIGDTVICHDGHYFEIKQVHKSEHTKYSPRWQYAVKDDVPRYEYDYEGESNQAFEDAIIGKADLAVCRVVRELKGQVDNWKELAEKIHDIVEPEFRDH